MMKRQSENRILLVLLSIVVWRWFRCRLLTTVLPNYLACFYSLRSREVMDSEFLVPANDYESKTENVF